jgi:hypothetical protein
MLAMSTRHLQRLQPPDPILQVGNFMLDKRDSLVGPLCDRGGLGGF